VKKDEQNINLFNQQFSSNKEVENSAQKTTNVNILLNRVRLDKKKVFKKKIIFSIILIFLVSSLAIFFTF
tara:strand:+ start:270 stop:479 length:210 start_codon:yes stop_codon:yes gene_type:complete